MEEDGAVVEVPFVAGAKVSLVSGPPPPPPVDGVLAGVAKEGVSLEACDTGLEGAWQVWDNLLTRENTPRFASHWG